jgi:mono/diheme cytochrome c family protein
VRFLAASVAHRYREPAIVATVFFAMLGAAISFAWREAPRASVGAQDASAPTFYRDVLPILQQRCQSCHRAGESGPLPFFTYQQARAEARSIAYITAHRKMPPWFADPSVGHFANDPSLTPQEIETFSAWYVANSPAGDPHDAPPPRVWTNGWNIPQPGATIKMPKPVALPATGDIDYTYEIVPTHFTRPRWVQLSEIRPSSRESVHHAVVYVRPPGSKWLAHAPVGVPFTAADMPDDKSHRDALWTDADILLVYAPGSAADRWPAGMAKLVPAGSDLVFQMHYMARDQPKTDQTEIGLIFAKRPPKQRVLTLQLTNDHFVIPPGADDYRVEARGTLPNDATLLSFLPHMHLRGKRFEYNIVDKDGTIEPLLRVSWDFYWQLSYQLAQPLRLQAGTELQAVAWYDNSKANPHNPDPSAAVRWGDQTYDEMMVGFFDVAVRADLDKWKYFERSGGSIGEPH